MNEQQLKSGPETSHGTLSEKYSSDLCEGKLPSFTFGFSQAIDYMRQGGLITRSGHSGHMQILKGVTVQHVEQDGAVHAFRIPELLVINRQNRPGGYELVTLDNSDLMAQDYVLLSMPK